MEILFTKKSDEDHIFCCKRKDGSTTWKHINTFFMLHDLCHYAVETILPLRNAFLGMIAAGTDINDFDLPKEQRELQLTEEALFAEHLVNLLVIDYTQGRMENLPEVFSAIYDGNNESYLVRLITDVKLEQVRKTYSELLQQWKIIPVPGSLNLLFEE